MTHRAVDLLQEETDRLAQVWRTESADRYRRDTLGALIRSGQRVEEILRDALRLMNEG